MVKATRGISTSGTTPALILFIQYCYYYSLFSMDTVGKSRLRKDEVARVVVPGFPWIHLSLNHSTWFNSVGGAPGELSRGGHHV